VWSAPIDKREFPCERELDNPRDISVVVIVKGGQKDLPSDNM